MIIYCILFNIDQIKDISYFSFTYTSSFMKNPDTTYKVEIKENKYYAYIKPYGKPAEETIKKQIDKNFVSKLIKILNEYKVSKWNGFDKRDKHILDGNSFRIIITSNNKNINASGYMKYPNNYQKVKTKIDLLFKEIKKGGLKWKY